MLLPPLLCHFAWVGHHFRETEVLRILHQHSCVYQSSQKKLQDKETKVVVWEGVMFSRNIPEIVKVSLTL